MMDLSLTMYVCMYVSVMTVVNYMRAQLGRMHRLGTRPTVHAYTVDL